MKAVQPFIVLFATTALLCGEASGADTNRAGVGKKPIVPASPVQKEPLAPAGQTFSRPATTFSPAVPPQIPVKEGTFNRPESTFSTPTGSFSRPASTFSNPTQATSPLPPGAYGAPIRPPSTFASPPDGTTFNRPTTILPIEIGTPLLQESSVGGFGAVQTEQNGTTVSPAPPVVIDLPPGAVIRKVAPPAAQEKK